MTSDKAVEGVAIARLYGFDQGKVVGWVYQWNTGALSIRWNDYCAETFYVDPPLSVEILERAEVEMGGDFVTYLRNLSSIGSE